MNLGSPTVVELSPSLSFPLFSLPHSSLCPALLSAPLFSLPRSSLCPAHLSAPLFSLPRSSQEKAAISHGLESRISVLRTELQESKAQLQVTIPADPLTLALSKIEKLLTCEKDCLHWVTL